MRNKLLISIGIVIVLALTYLCSMEKVFEGGNVYLVERYNPLNQTMTVTLRVKGKYINNGFIYFINPVVTNIQNLDKNGRKIVEIPVNLRDFIDYGSYYESKKTVPMSFIQFNQSKRVKL